MENAVMDLTDLMETIHLAQRQGENVRTQLQAIRTGLQNVIVSKSLEGERKRAVERVIQEQHLPLLRALENAFFKLFQKAREMNQAFQIHMNESSQDAVYHYEYLHHLEGDLDHAHNE